MELITTLGQRNCFQNLNNRNIPDVPEAVIRGAVRAVQESGLSVRFAASRYRMVHTAPHYRTKKINNSDECNQPNVSTSRYTSRQNFNVNQALISMDYVIKFSELNYGTTCKKFRQPAYDFGRRLQSNFPNSWIVNNMAGIDWLQGFMKNTKSLHFASPNIQVC
jgi:hypothetical protein